MMGAAPPPQRAPGLPDGHPPDDRPLIHVVWIGSPPPSWIRDCIESWRRMNPTWRLCVWDDHRTGWINQAQMDRTREWTAKADMMRYEILLAHGGIAIDADCECVKPLDEGDFRERIEGGAVSCYENETCRAGLLANGFMGGPPGHPLWRACVEECATADMRLPPWESVGPEMLTRIAARIGGLHAYPSRHFIPVHHTGAAAPGDAPIFARQLWGNTKGAYPHSPKTTDWGTVIASTVLGAGLVGTAVVVLLRSRP